MIMFVCTGNTCRSPMAEALAGTLHPGREFTSRGVHVDPSSHLGKNAAATLKNIYGIKGFRHIPRQISGADMETAAVVLTMTSSHKKHLTDMYPAHAGKVFTLAEAAGTTGDVPDPFGGGPDIYAECAETLHAFIKKLNFEELSMKINKKDDDKSRVALGCDRAGLELMETVKDCLNDMSTAFFDCCEGKVVNDYPVAAARVTDAVLAGDCCCGILVCGTGLGMSIAANRRSGIRAALCGDVYTARMSRLHNDANILALGGRVTGRGLAAEIVETFLSTPFSGEERHVKRVGMIDGR